LKRKKKEERRKKRHQRKLHKRDDIGDRAIIDEEDTTDWWGQWRAGEILVWTTGQRQLVRRRHDAMLRGSLGRERG